MPADLFHVTRRRDVEEIAENGLQRFAESAAMKQAREYGDEGSMDVEMIEDPRTVKADRAFDELLGDAQREVEDAQQYPDHADAVFFWPTKDRAIRAAGNTDWAGVIVAVDRAEMPDDCRFARGDIEIADYIWEQYWDLYGDRGVVDQEAIFEDAKRFWRDVTWYEGQAGRDDEIWTDCDVPPGAIEYIEDVETGRVIREPVDAAQSTLHDFADQGST